MTTVLLCGTRISDLNGWEHDAVVALCGPSPKFLSCSRPKNADEYRAACEPAQPDLVYIPTEVLGLSLTEERPMFVDMLSILPHYTHIKKGVAEVLVIVDFDEEKGLIFSVCDDAAATLSA